MSLIGAVKDHAENMFTSWTDDVRRQTLALIEPNDGCAFVDLGCGDCVATAEFANAARAGSVVGVEGLEIKDLPPIPNFRHVEAELNRELPLDSESFDVVISHFSIEHLYNTGLFIQETLRILKPGGYTVVATDNLSAWPNVISLLMGWQPFSSAHGIALRALGNPFALRSGEHGGVDVEEELTYESEQWRRSGEWSHNKVLSWRTLGEAYKEFGFSIEDARGSGYFPFAGRISQLLARADPRHSHLMILKARKPA